MLQKKCDVTKEIKRNKMLQSNRNKKGRGERENSNFEEDKEEKEWKMVKIIYVGRIIKSRQIIQQFEEW